MKNLCTQHMHLYTPLVHPIKQRRNPNHALVLENNNAKSMLNVIYYGNIAIQHSIANVKQHESLSVI
jgi:hypothetical protein